MDFLMKVYLQNLANQRVGRLFGSCFLRRRGVKRLAVKLPRAQR
jgi:hypothetical protein